MATYRGSKGTVTVGGNTVGELQSWTLTINRAYIETTAMGDAAKTGTLDIPGGSGDLSANFDYSDTAQAALLDMLVSNTDPTPLAAVFEIDTGKTISCNILPTSAPVAAQRGALVTVSFSFETDGPIAFAWA
ncbi:MAG TPA: hypothetical protein VF188_00465 [Longimicrobiales bacterium]